MLDIIWVIGVHTALRGAAEHGSNLILTALVYLAAVRDRLGGVSVVIFFERGARSALDSQVLAEGREIGASGVFVPRVVGRELTLAVDAGGFVDRETGSHWDLFGQAVEGPLKGKQLKQVSHVDTFWFAWAAFSPKTVIWSPHPASGRE